MKWKMRGGGYAPNIAVSTAKKAAKEYEVPVGILLGTVECESGFRLGLTSSAGAVGPCQFLPGYAPARSDTAGRYTVGCRPAHTPRRLRPTHHTWP